MRAHEKLAAPTPDTIRLSLLQTVEGLLQSLRPDKELLERIDQAQCQLDALPLATGQYGVACNRLAYAYRYLVSQERGAARYELKLLAASLRHGHDAHAAAHQNGPETPRLLPPFRRV